MAFFFIFSETDRHLSHVYTKEVTPPPRKKKFLNQVVATHTHQSTQLRSLMTTFNERAPRESDSTLGGQKEKWIKIHHTFCLFVFFTSSIYFKQSRLGLIGWGERDVWRETKKRFQQSRGERKTRSKVSINQG